MTRHSFATRERSRLRAVALASSLFIVFALCTAAPALAGERVHFKNGHMLEVISSRTDGAMVYLRLPDKSEIGVPAALIAEVEGGRDVPVVGAQQVGNFSGRGPALTDLIGYKQLAAQSGPKFVGEVTQEGLSEYKRSNPNQPMTFGFSFRGSSDISNMNLSRGPQVRVNDLSGSTSGSAVQWGPAKAATTTPHPGSIQPQTTEPNPQSGPP